MGCEVRLIIVIRTLKGVFDRKWAKCSKFGKYYGDFEAAVSVVNAAFIRALSASVMASVSSTGGS
jgi:hypothetical protein